MRRRWALLLLALLPATVAGAGVPLSEAWYRVQQGLEAGRPDEARRGVADLVRLGERAGAARMSVWARALVLWAGKHPGSDGGGAVDLALQLDPSCAEAHFLRAQWEWSGGQRAQAAADYARGWVDTLRDPLRGTELKSSLAGWGLVSLLVAGLAVLGVETLRFVPEVVHDAYELGQLLFSRSNAVIFAAVAVALPLFAGLGPAWWLAYLFALAWIYFPVREKVVLGMLWVILLGAVPWLDLWQSWALKDPSPVERTGALVARGIVDPLAVEELLTLEPDLRGLAPYHLLAGEALHLTGDSLGAVQQFKRASLASPDDPLPNLWLGNLALEDGDVHLAIQQYRSAVQKGPSLGMAYYNLSVALDQDHLFSEADQARSRARALGLTDYPFRYHEVDGLRLAYPDDVPLLVRRVLREAPKDKQALVNPPALPVDVGSWFAAPWTVTFLSTGILGLLLWWARRRWMWVAQACSRCGKVFCSRCKTSTESSSYCSQCISVFLTRGAVSIDQQAAKVDQIRRRERKVALVRRLASAVLVGSGCLLKGRPIRGTVLVLLGIMTATGVVVWGPLFAGPLARPAGVVPLQAALAVLFVIFWAVSVRRGWEGV